jgi:hypothetical protein
MTQKNAKFYEELLKKEYPQLIAHRNGKRRKMWRNVIFYEIAFAAVAYGAYDYIVRNLAFWGDVSIVWKGIIVGLILAIIPPFFFKTSIDMRGKTVVGDIESIKYEIRFPQTGNTRALNYKNGQEFMKMKVNVGKKKPLTISYRSHISQALKQGDRIVKFKGFPFPAEEVEKEERYICVVCGRVVKKDVKDCPACSLPIIHLYEAAQPKDIWAQFEDNVF